MQTHGVQASRLDSRLARSTIDQSKVRREAYIVHIHPFSARGGEEWQEERPAVEPACVIFTAREKAIRRLRKGKLPLSP